MLRKGLFFTFAILALASAANAATILGVYLDPATTAGGGSTSTRSGVGTLSPLCD